jgi:hypothetical protein
MRSLWQGRQVLESTGFTALSKEGFEAVPAQKTTPVALNASASRNDVARIPSVL